MEQIKINLDTLTNAFRRYQLEGEWKTFTKTMRPNTGRGPIRKELDLNTLRQSILLSNEPKEPDTKLDDYFERTRLETVFKTSKE
ncbi:MAG: hypothetical protein JEY71_15265 [Sphaerochaeta sp.]|nr:hypothetical protein [Sphaerochaeta sp.]